MSVTVACPNLLCKKRLQGGEHLRGKKVRCPHCGQLFGIPERKRPVKPPTDDLIR